MKQPKYFETVDTKTGVSYLFSKRLNPKNGTFPLFSEKFKLKLAVPLRIAEVVIRPVKKGQSLTWADVAMDATLPAYKIRREMEAAFGPQLKKAA